MSQTCLAEINGTATGTGLQRMWAAPDFSRGLIPFSIAMDAYGLANRAFVPDPAGSDETVLEVVYPAGSRNPQGSILGGTGFYSNPIDLSRATKVLLEYQWMPSPDFNFVKGGKLPGLYGGRMSCSGGDKAGDCFSTRYMFRKQGMGELYIYLNQSAQLPDICTIRPMSICNPKFGNSIGRGSFTFLPGRWNRIRQIITLNSVRNGSYEYDGKLEVYYFGNGTSASTLATPVIYFDKVVWRTLASVRFVGITFDTFFGGSDDSYRTPTTQQSFFKGFVMQILQ
ncbi:hypothetical protein BJ742DRAFT_157698 [Cladochytrium replicatum]|nr:hypothetical protein BJ742DRAFT_157698 [Cladochytrium replicatum]